MQENICLSILCGSEIKNKCVVFVQQRDPQLKLVSLLSINMLRMQRFSDMQPLSDIGVIAASDIPAGSKIGPSHEIPNILVKANEERKMSYALKVMFYNNNNNNVQQ